MTNIGVPWKSTGTLFSGCTKDTRLKSPLCYWTYRNRKIYAYPYNDFKSDLTERSQVQLEEQYEAAILDNKMVVFVRDNEKEELVSYSLEY